MSEDTDKGDGDNTETARDLFSGDDSPSEEEDVREDTGAVDETDDPFAELGSAEDAEARAGELEDLFESVETPDLDEEAVWEAVLSDDEEMVDADPRGMGADAVVPKDQYCKRCEFFSDPPDVTCTNPGTEIEALVGVDKFRVTNCPIVARRGRANTVFADEE